MIGLLGSLRSLVFGETWTIPVGMGSALITALIVRGAVPDRAWAQAGGFVIAALVVATLAASLRGSG